MIRLIIVAALLKIHVGLRMTKAGVKDDPSYETEDMVQKAWLSLIALEGLICEVEHTWLLFPEKTKNEIQILIAELEKSDLTAEQKSKLKEIISRYNAKKDAVKQIDWECGCIHSHGMTPTKEFEGTKIRDGYGSSCAKWESMKGMPFHDDCEKDGHSFCGCSWCYVHADCSTSRKSKVFKDTSYSECHDKKKTKEEQQEISKTDSQEEYAKKMRDIFYQQKEDEQQESEETIEEEQQDTESYTWEDAGKLLDSDDKKKTKEEQQEISKTDSQEENAKKMRDIFYQQKEDEQQESEETIEEEQQDTESYTWEDAGKLLDSDKK